MTFSLEYRPNQMAFARCSISNIFDFCETTRHTPGVVATKAYHSDPSAKNEQSEYAT